jgi:hypothetical protein
LIVEALQIEMVKVCPNPKSWHEIHERLLAAWTERSIGERPPMPLILNGWAATNDVEKLARWQETVEWAKKHNLEELVSMAGKEWYSVESPSSEPVRFP